MTLTFPFRARGISYKRRNRAESVDLGVVTDSDDSGVDQNYEVIFLTTTSDSVSYYLSWDKPRFKAVGLCLDFTFNYTIFSLVLLDY